MLKDKVPLLLSITLLTGCGMSNNQESSSVTESKEHKITEEDVITTPSISDPLNESIHSEEEETKIEQQEEEEISMLHYEASDAEDEKNEKQKNEKNKPPTYTTETFKETFQITASAANIRNGPHTSYPTITTLNKNEKLEVFEKAFVDGTTWYHFKSSEVDGWISESIVKKYKPVPKPKFTAEPFEKELEIAVSVGNVRTGPATSFSVQTSLKAYTKLSAKEKAVVNGETWYHVQFSDNMGWVSSAIVDDYNPDRKFVLIDAPHTRQLPELPRGCEVTSLSMLLGHAGVNVNKMTLAQEIRRDPTPYQVKDGKIYFGNPYDGFVGDMYSFETPGLGVYHGPIAELAQKYLPGRIVNLSGQSFNAIYQQLDKGKPVWVIVTSTYAYLPSAYWETWHTPSGPIKITMKEHSVLVTGYDDHFIYFNDPLAGKNRKVSKANFIAGWEQIGKQAISYN